MHQLHSITNKKNSKAVTLNELQTNVDEWIKTFGVRYFNELTNLGILQEEVGELSRHIVRLYGEQSYKQSEAHITVEERKKQMADEMADVLWVLTCLANQTGIDLTTAMKDNLDKKTQRDATRHIENKKL
jgi:NTP pyrophosphatase (non-canonical NTP hydrolase)